MRSRLAAAKILERTVGDDEAAAREKDSLVFEPQVAPRTEINSKIFESTHILIASGASCRKDVVSN